MHKSVMDSEWFKARKRELKITDAALASVLGVERSVANKVTNGKVPLNGKRADAVAALFQVGRDEILYRAGLTQEAPKAPAASTATHPPRRPDQPPVRSADVGETVTITQLDLSLAMGPGTIIEEFVEAEQVAFDLSVLRRITRTPSDRLRFVTGIGTSHEPKFQSNDQFLIDINERRLTRIDGYYWITFDGAHALKRLRPLGGGRVQVISENPEYAPMELDASDVRIEGRAIWFARGL